MCRLGEHREAKEKAPEACAWRALLCTRGLYPRCLESCCKCLIYKGFLVQEMCGGDEEDRTPDLRIANATLSQLSYAPTRRKLV